MVDTRDLSLKRRQNVKMLTWGITMWYLKRKIKCYCKWSYNQQISSQTGSQPLMEKSGKNAEKDGDQSKLVVHGLWISSGQVLLRQSSVWRATLFRQPESGGCLCLSSLHSGSCISLCQEIWSLGSRQHGGKQRSRAASRKSVVS